MERRPRARILSDMGAFDEFSAAAPCFACGDIVHVHAQRKFLAPDFGGLHARWLRVGEAVPIDFAPRELLDAEVWEDEGVRLHDASISSELRLLHDLDDLWSCHCGASLAPVLRLRFRDDGALPGLEGSAHRHEVELAAMELRGRRTCSSASTSRASSSSCRSRETGGPTTKGSRR